MRLMEFRKPNFSVNDLVSALRKKFTLERVGGDTRFYEIGEHGLLGIIFIVDGGPKAVGIGWDRDFKNVSTIYVWNNFDPDKSPDAALDIPSEATMQNSISSIHHFIKQSHTGIVENIISESRSVSPEEFKDIVVRELGKDAAKVSKPELEDIASKHDVKMPHSILTNDDMKVDSYHWNLLTDLHKNAPVKELDPTDSIILLGRTAQGAFFKLPKNVSKILDTLDKAAPKGEHGSMEEQYEYLQEQVKLVAGGKSNFVKSLLITGAPSSGKTYNVMKTVKDDLKFDEGEDYVIKKGHITSAVLMRLFIEQIDGLLIFDDCDSVVSDEKAVNMLKGALDTDPIREVSYDIKGTINTAVMPYDDRISFVDAVSRFLKGEATDQDVIDNRKYLPKKEPKKDEKKNRFRSYFDDNIEDDKKALTDFFSKHLPNKIDFRGRIIFISNHERDWWDEAIITRAFNIDMNFSDEEMLDFIYKIKHTMKTPGLTEAQKTEVLDYIKGLWKSGSLTRPINFRLIQAAFDLRLVNNWKKIVGRL